MTNSTNHAQEEEFNSLLTCTRLFAELQTLEPLLIKNRSVFITRTHHAHIHFRIMSNKTNAIVFARDFNWRHCNTETKLRTAIDQTYRDLIAANLITINTTTHQ